jgi:hypothetical protein
VCYPIRDLAGRDARAFFYIEQLVASFLWQTYQNLHRAKIDDLPVPARRGNDARITIGQVSCLYLHGGRPLIPISRDFNWGTPQISPPVTPRRVPECILEEIPPYTSVNLGTRVGSQSVSLCTQRC